MQALGVLQQLHAMCKGELNMCQAAKHPEHTGPAAGSSSHWLADTRRYLQNTPHLRQ